MRRGVCHAAAATRPTKAPTFAGKWHDPVLSTLIAVSAQKAVGQNSTLEKRPQLPFYEPGHQTITAPLPLQEGLEMPGHDAIEHALGRITRTID
jgi:hypothetical protein